MNTGKARSCRISPSGPDLGRGRPVKKGEEEAPTLCHTSRNGPGCMASKGAENNAFWRVWR